MAISGASGYVCGETVASWKERLVQGYSKEDIWNRNEAGCFFQIRALA